jgi:dimethylargininase
MRTALTRPVPASLARCELTHLDREPIDVALASEQHRQYEAALRALGCTIRQLPAADDQPDSVFVEDTAIVLDELAVMTRPGVESRRGERESVAPVLSEYRDLVTIAAPGTIDGGDVLRLGETLFVGLSSRTNEDGVKQLARFVERFGYSVQAVQTKACLHLKSAATALAADRVLCNPAWVDEKYFAGIDVVHIAPGEPRAANVLCIGNSLICTAAHERTIADLRGRGYSVIPIDVSELAKAEAGVTCCSVIVE